MPQPRWLNALMIPAALGLAAPGARGAELTVEISGAVADTGQVEVSLFDSAETFMKEPLLQQSGRPDADGQLRIVFAALPQGDYAVVAVHDEDANGRLDSGFFGIGGEAYGFSNEVRPWFGWPDFEQASFRLDGDLRIELRLD